MDKSQLIPTGRETWEGIKAVANVVMQKAGVTGGSKKDDPDSGFDIF